jgi:hypothetical protein
MTKTSHKDVEFVVNGKHLKSFDKACGDAVASSLARGVAVNIDVLAYSKAGAKWCGIEDYDPDASVSGRISITSEDHGKIA